MATIPDVNAGDRPSASHINAIRDAAVREFSGPVAHSDNLGAMPAPLPGQQVALYELTADPVLDEDVGEYYATAKPVLPCASAGYVVYTLQSSARDETIWFPAGSRDGEGAPASAPTEVTGSRVWTDLSFGHRVVLGGASGAGGDTVVPFELKDDLILGDYSPVDAWTLDADLHRDEEADTFEVADSVLKNIHALGSDTMSEDEKDGARGFALLLNGAYAIIACDRITKMISGTLASALEADDMYCQILNPVAMDGGQLPPGDIYAWNVFTVEGFYGNAGARCVAVLNEAWSVEESTQYELIDVECPPEEA